MFTGIVEELGTVVGLTRLGSGARLTVAAHAVTADPWETVHFELPPGLTRYVVEKGSIAVDGVSLTVVEVDAGGFAVGLIPTTLKLTTLGHKEVGDPVNLEVDVIAKYVEKLVSG